ncbi:sensor histidine kinase [Streptomonospora nanhaiensis]|uniref:sensor histidine kinase n=1 Tax=Streptomonospora nanhaiensis TaxID=1323731 RepID=UPI0027DEC1CE|nr:sensor histidine kinase [Streptomonospora nanhaiensis]
MRSTPAPPTSSAAGARRAASAAGRSSPGACRARSRTGLGQSAAPVPSRSRLRSALPALLTDAFIVVALVVLNSSLVELARTVPAMAQLWGEFTAGHIGGALLALTMLARRHLPFTVLLVLTLSGLVGDHTRVLVWGTASLGIAVAAYSVGRYLPLTRALIALGTGVVVNVLATTLSPAQAGDPGEPWWINQGFYLGWLLAAWWVGRLVRMRAFHMEELATRAERLERARDAHTRAVLAEERSRIARELHDVVAHHVSVMTVQATAGRRVIDRSPERARQTLVEIEETGRQAMAEMRRIVGVLRMAEGGGPDRGPQPGLAGLAELVQQVRDTGTRTELRVSGEPPELAPGLGLTVYRIVQESLTNVLKHAGRGARAAVEVRFTSEAVEVVVTDEGPPPGGEGEPGPRRAADEPGHGLVGMRERVALYGGDLRTGPRAGGGFEVRARLPLDRRGPG